MIPSSVKEDETDDNDRQTSDSPKTEDTSSESNRETRPGT